MKAKRYCQATGKRMHASRKAAREAHKALDSRLRLYQCGACHCWHIADADKRASEPRRPKRRARR